MPRIPLIPAAVLVLSACGGGIAVNTDYDPLAAPRMEAWRRWTWQQVPAGRPPRADSAVAGPVRAALEAALAARGYALSPDSAEFRVGWHAAVEGPLNVTETNNWYGYAWGRWFPEGGVAFSRGFLTEYEAGALVVDVVDPRSNDLVWRGIARQVFRRGRSTAEQQRALDEAVARLLGQFPP